jgi:hypothetical protein
MMTGQGNGCEEMKIEPKENEIVIEFDGLGWKIRIKEFDNVVVIYRKPKHGDWETLKAIEKPSTE